jgi:hypothetical protein
VNDEANLDVYDRDFEEWVNRRWTEKLREHALGLFSRSFRQKRVFFTHRFMKTG